LGFGQPQRDWKSRPQRPRRTAYSSLDNKGSPAACYTTAHGSSAVESDACAVGDSFASAAVGDGGEGADFFT